MGFFITKKQQQTMKERRKKKKMAEKGLFPIPSSTTPKSQQLNGTVDDKNINDTSSSTNKKKRLRSDIEEENDGTIHEENHQQQEHQEPSTSKISSINRQGVKVFTITIPAGFSSKDIKKFRKDARRKLRNENNEIEIKEENIHFVLESDETTKNSKSTSPTSANGEVPSIAKKQKRIYPCINELLKLQKQQEKEMILSSTITSDNNTNTDTVGTTTTTTSNSIATLDKAHTSQFVALDCEMVGIGSNGRQSALARVSIVNWDYDTQFDTFVQVPMKVTDYRTSVSGIKPKHIQSYNNAMDVTECRNTVAKIIQNKILVGHALKNDLDALLLTHPITHIRDTAKYRPFQRMTTNNSTIKWRPRKLRDLALEHCNIKIQVEGQSHDSIDDAKATMALYRTVHTTWEKEIVLSNQRSSNNKKGKVNNHY
jgi:RNA exonuclease 4